MQTEIKFEIGEEGYLAQTWGGENKIYACKITEKYASPNEIDKNNIYYFVEYLQPKQDGEIWTSEFNSSEEIRRFWPTQIEAYDALVRVLEAQISKIKSILNSSQPFPTYK